MAGIVGSVLILGHRERSRPTKRRVTPTPIRGPVPRSAGWIPAFAGMTAMHTEVQGATGIWVVDHCIRRFLNSVPSWRNHLIRIKGLFNLLH